MLKIAICDDEPIYINEIEKRTIDFFELEQINIKTYTFSDVKDFLNSKIAEYNIIFLDVEIGDYNGIELAKNIRMHNKTAIIIYISAFIKYAVDGYSVKALRYLLKSDLSSSFAPCLQEVLLELPSQTMIFNIPTLNKNISINDILYLESKDHYVLIHFKNNDVVSYIGTLHEADTILKAKGFLRVQKSFIVNMRCITNIKGRSVTLENGQSINCSKQNYQEILQTYLLWEGR